jgi:hypothetical protein
VYVGYEEAQEAIRQGKKVNFYYKGHKVVLDKNSTMNDLYKKFGYIQMTVNAVVNGKFIII